MKCTNCKTEEMQESVNSYFAQLSECYVIIENVPCYKCAQCGEVYYNIAVLERIDDILETMENITSKVQIIDYKEAA